MSLLKKAKAAQQEQDEFRDEEFLNKQTLDQDERTLNKVTRHVQPEEEETEEVQASTHINVDDHTLNDQDDEMDVVNPGAAIAASLQNVTFSTNKLSAITHDDFTARRDTQSQDISDSDSDNAEFQQSFEHKHGDSVAALSFRLDVVIGNIGIVKELLTEIAESANADEVKDKGAEITRQLNDNKIPNLLHDNIAELQILIADTKRKFPNSAAITHMQDALEHLTNALVNVENYTNQPVVVAAQSTDVANNDTAVAVKATSTVLH